MKKIKVLSLMLVALMLLLVGCGKKPANNNEALTKAKKYVHAMYKDEASVTPDSYELVSQVKVDGVTYTVDWTITVKKGSGEAVKAGKNDTGKTVITVDKKTSEDVEYTLTFTVKDEKGNALSQSYEKSVPAFKSHTWEEYKNAENGTILNVTGVVTGIIAKSKGNSNNCIYLQDEVGGFYAYGLSADPATSGIKEGMTVMVTGSKTTYSGTLELENATFEILDETIKVPEAVDYTQKFLDAATTKDADLVDKQALLVTLKGVELTDMNESSGYLNFKLGDKTAYVRISSSVCPLVSADQTALKAKHVSGMKANVTGVICVFDGAFYLTPVTVDAIEHVKEVLTDAQKVERAEAKVLEMKDVVYATDLDLFTELASIEGVSVSWTSANTDLIANDGKLGNYPLEETAVELTATITAGSETKTVKVSVKVAALARIDITAALAACDENNGQTVLIKGKLIGKDTDGYGFVADETGVVYVRTKFTDINVGENVQVIGTATVYTSNQYTRQIGSATITKITDEIQVLAPVVISLEDLAACADNAAVISNRFYGKLVTVTGYVTTRGKYNNAFIAKANDAESFALGCYYKGTGQDEIKAFAGKVVSFTAPVYNYSFSDNTWLLGSYTEIKEGETTLAKLEGAKTITEVYGLEKDAALVVEGQVKHIVEGTGLVITDGENNLFVYTKNSLAEFRVGDFVAVSGKKGTYNSAPQVANPTITLRGTGKFELNPTVKTIEEIHALDSAAATSYGKEFTLKGTVVASGKYVNLKVGETTYSLYLSDADKEILKEFADKEVELTVLTYNFNSKNSVYNFFAVASSAKLAE